MFKYPRLPNHRPPSQADPTPPIPHEVGYDQCNVRRRRLSPPYDGRHFHSEKAAESFLSQPLLAGLPQSAAALPRASPLTTWAGGGSASTSHPTPLICSTSACSSP